MDKARSTDYTPTNRTWRVDAAVPTVTGVILADLAKGVRVGKNLTATFSEAMGPGKLPTSTFQLVSS